MTKDILYTVGGTVQPGRGIYVPRKADKELFNLCSAAKLAYVLTSRQMGKSSLMAHTAAELEIQGIKTATVDLSLIGQESEEKWYFGILAELENQLELDFDVFDWWQSQEGHGKTYRLSKFFRYLVEQHISERLVVFFDEVDYTLKLDYSDNFYGALRALHNERSRVPELNRLSFVLIGVATPIELIQDASRTPFNIGVQVELSDFTEEEASPFAIGFRLSEPESRKVLQRVMYWTDGHPYLTQRFCYHIASNPPPEWTNEEIDNRIKQEALHRGSNDTHLKKTWDMLVNRAPVRLQQRIFRIFQKIRRRRNGVTYDSRLVELPFLKLSGIVKRVGDNLVIRNNLYREVFNRKWISKHSQIPFYLKYERFILPSLIFLGLLSIVLLILYNISLNQIQLEQSFSELQEDYTENQEENESLLRVQDTLLTQITQSREQLNNLEQSKVEAESLIEDLNSSIVSKQDSIESLQKEKTNLHVELLDNQVRLMTTQDELNIKEDSLQHIQDSLGLVLQEKIEADQKTLSVTLASQAKRLSDVEDDGLAALMALNAEEYNRLSKGAYLNEVLDALQLSRNSLLVVARETSIPISDPFREFEILDLNTTPDDSTVAYSDNGGAITIWTKGGTTDESIGEQTYAILFISPPKKPQSIALSSDGKKLAVLLDEKELELYHPQADEFGVITWQKDSRFVANPYNRPTSGTLLYLNNDQYIGVIVRNEIQLIDSATGKFHKPLQLPDSLSSHNIQDVVTFEDKIIAGSQKGHIIQWDDIDSDPIVLSIKSDTAVTAIDVLAISNDGNELAIGGRGDKIPYGIWLSDMDTQANSHNLATTSVLFDHRGPIYSLAYSDNWLASGSADGTIRLWPREGNNLTVTNRALIFKGHQRWVRNVGFMLDGNELISGSADGTVRRWALNTKQLVSDICNNLSPFPSPEEWNRLFIDIEYPQDLCDKNKQGNTP